MSDSISIGTAIFIAVKPIIKIYLIIFVGWLLVKTNIMTMETSRGISNMVVNALLPCLSFNKIVTNLSGSQIKEIGIVVLTAVLIFGTGGALAYLATFITPVPQKWVYGLIFGGIFANISDLPIAYIQSMGTGIVFNSEEADKGVALSCIFLACQQFMMMNLGMFQIVGLDFRSNTDQNDEEKNISESDETHDHVVSSHDEDFNVVALVRDGSDTESGISSNNSQRRRRRSSTSESFRRVISHDSAYSTRSRGPRQQNVQSLIDEYSEAESVKRANMGTLAKTISRSQEIGLKLDENDEDNDHHSTSPKPKYPKWNEFITKYKLGWFEYILVNFKRVPSVVILISIVIAMVPWLRALFVKNSIDIQQAPDRLPALNFIMDFTSYIGNSAIPMGLLLLGGTIARLEIQTIPKGFWKTSLFMIASRLVVMPIFGVLWANRLYSSGWITDNISRFVLIISWSVPSATAQVYFTAFYTPLEGDHIQMDCLAIFLIMQYPILIITLSIVVTYVLKVNLGL